MPADPTVPPGPQPAALVRDLHGPLTVILGRTQLISRALEADTPLDRAHLLQHVQEIEAQATHLRQRIHDEQRHA